MNWESLIGERIASHRETHKVCKIQDASLRNKRRAQIKWKHEHREQVNETARKWRAKNPDKVKRYQENAKPAIKKWAEEHPERRRELNRKSDAKRAKDPKRIAWKKEYAERPEVKARRAEYNKAREQKPERIAWKKAYEEKRKNDPKRIAWKKDFNERKKLERKALKEA